jgi:hypothetical protein
MMKISFTDSRWLFIFFFFLLIWGCGATPDIISDKPAEGEKYSSAQVREMTVDQPFMLSGDYFREKRQKKPLDLNKAFTSEKELKQGQEDLESRVAKLEKGASEAQLQLAPVASVTAGPEVPPGVENTLKIKVGLLIDRKKVTTADANRLDAAAFHQTENLPVILVSPDDISETLAQSGALEKRDLASIAGVVGLYPGVRMLTLVEAYRLPEKLPGVASATVNIVDTGLPFRYRPMEIQMPVNSEADVNSFTATVLLTTFEKSVDKSRIMPWFCRSFSRENNIWYINAGKHSGLKLGDELMVLSGGKLVKSPAGFPAGWILGTQKGLLKVDLFFGKDLAACSLMEGKGPEPEDILVK